MVDSERSKVAVWLMRSNVSFRHAEMFSGLAIVAWQPAYKTHGWRVIAGFHIHPGVQQSPKCLSRSRRRLLRRSPRESAPKQTTNSREPRTGIKKHTRTKQSRTNGGVKWRHKRYIITTPSLPPHLHACPVTLPGGLPACQAPLSSDTCQFAKS